MRKSLLFFFAILTVTQYHSNAQTGIIDGDPSDSTIIRFNNDSLLNFLPDTATIPLWQIGTTNKAFYPGDTFYRKSMLTDTLNPYPINANNWFTIKIKKNFNTIVDFWHRYNTDSSRDGGIVEFSTDHGMIWQNIKGDCNVDSGFGVFQGVHTDNFYTFNDTLETGEPAFSGSAGTTQYSRLQFFDGFPVKTTSPGCSWGLVDTFYVRFRFVSDTVADTLAGWEIDSIKIEQDDYGGGGVKVVKSIALNVYPNPSIDGRFTFPVLKDEQLYNVEVYNNMGQRILQCAYGHLLDLSMYPSGLYFYKVSDGTAYYSGQLFKE